MQFRFVSQLVGDDAIAVVLMAEQRRLHGPRWNLEGFGDVETAKQNRDDQQAQREIGIPEIGALGRLLFFVGHGDSSRKSSSANATRRHPAYPAPPEMLPAGLRPRRCCESAFS